MPPATPVDYSLYLDESGGFTEINTPEQQTFPSQVAGFLVCQPKDIEKQAKTIILDAFADLQRTPPRGKDGVVVVHGVDVCRALGKDKYSELIQALLQQLPRDWQPVRLVNRERIHYGKRAAYYKNMVAEIALRICLRLRTTGKSHGILDLTCEQFGLGATSSGRGISILPDQYQQQLQEYFSFAAVRHGWASQAAPWRIGQVSTGGKTVASLQIADLLSHASQNEYVPVTAAVAGQLRRAFADFDMSLTVRALLEQVDSLVGEGSRGAAVMVLANELAGRMEDDELHQLAEQRLQGILGDLAQQPAAARDIQLATIVSWLELLIDYQRLLEPGLTLAEWLQSHVALPLEERLFSMDDASSVYWFGFALQTQALTDFNHAGRLDRSRKAYQELNRRLPQLVCQLERVPLIVKGLVAQAVHLTDSFDHDDASRRMKLADGYYAQLAALYQEQVPQLFPDEKLSPLTMESEWHGRVLGTWVQSETLAGLASPQRLKAARELSDRAIAEFTARTEQNRQFQYRGSLEAAAGHFTEARKFLAKSLGRDEADSTHQAIAGAISQFAEQSVPQRFALLHWLTLGKALCLADESLPGVPAERDAFLAAMNPRDFAVRWRIAQWTDYPAHGVLRRLAAIHAWQQSADDALGMLDHLCKEHNPVGKRQITLATIQLAACAEVAGLLWGNHITRAKELLTGRADKTVLGLKQLLPDFLKSLVGFGKLNHCFQPWSQQINHCLANPPPANVRDILLNLARPIGY